MNSLRPRSSILVRALLCLCASAPALLADAEAYEGKTIATIQFVPPQQPLDPLELKEILPLQMGTPLRMAVVRDALERLYATGRYADIQVDAEPLGQQVIVRFYTKNSWFIGRVAVEGKLSDPPNRGQVVNATRLELGRPFNDDEIPQATANVKQLLESNGLYESALHPEYDYDPETQQVHIRFVVDSGRRARFAKPNLSGDLQMSEDKVVKATKWRRFLIHTWKPLTQTNVRQGVDGIRNKYQNEDRLEARVQLDSMHYNAENRRVTPDLKINAGPKVEVKVVGAKLSRGKLKRYIPIYDERTVDRDLLVEGTRNLRDYFQSQGYFEVEIEFKEQRLRNDKAVIDYLVNTGRRHRMVHLEITGNKYFTTDTLRERMYLQPKSLQFRHGRYSETFRRRDEEAIANLYKSNGFRDAAVASVVHDDYKGKAGDIAVSFNVTEGLQFFVSKLEVDGIQQIDAQTILPTLSSSEGQPYSEFNVASDRDTILAQYYSNGFPNAVFEWSSRPGAQPNLVELKFTVTEGRQQYVRQVLPSGLKTTRPGLVYRNIRLNPGEPLSPIQMTETQRRLYDLGVFAKVDMAIQNPDGETQRKYVLYQMEEASRYTLTGGVGAEIARIGGSQTNFDSPAGQAGFSPRVSFDVTRLNFLGVGHSVSFRTRFSTLQKRGVLNYSAPRFRNIEGRNLSFTALYDDSRDVRTFTAKRQEGSVQMSQKLSKPTTALFRFSYRRVSTTNIVIPSLLVPQLLQPVRIGILSGNLIQDRRDDPTDARKGIYNTVDVGVATRFFGSQRSFIRGLARNATYHRIGKKLVVARETTLGLLFPFAYSGSDQSVAVPFPERFFAGGGTSHRGFPENQAGPRDLGTPATASAPANAPTGFPLGGNAQLFNNTELRYPLIGENISGVLFHDAGNVYRGIGDISFRFRQRDVKDFDYMVHAVGFGVRYRTPIGPIRLDLAYSVNSPRFLGFKGTYQELLQCGSSAVMPCQSVEQRISRFQFFFSIGQTF